MLNSLTDDTQQDKQFSLTLCIYTLNLQFVISIMLRPLPFIGFYSQKAINQLMPVFHPQSPSLSPDIPSPPPARSVAILFYLELNKASLQSNDLYNAATPFDVRHFGLKLNDSLLCPVTEKCDHKDQRCFLSYFFHKFLYLIRSECGFLLSPEGQAVSFSEDSLCSSSVHSPVRTLTPVPFCELQQVTHSFCHLSTQTERE